MPPLSAPPPDDSILLPVGTRLGGQYAVEGVLGKPGGFGITYLARDEQLGVRVAVKEFFPRGLALRARDGLTIRPNTPDDAAALVAGRGRFLEEARMLARFNHPGIVRVRSFFEQHETAYLVMDYLDGLPLSQYLEREGGTLPWETALGVIRPVLAALAELHAVRVLHRDVDPHNVYVTRRGEVVLLDFGTAREAAEGSNRSLSVVLKPGYAPYEQYASRGRQGPWTDVYAAGALLYRMISGVVPQESTGRIMDDELRPLRELVPAVPARVDRAVMWALALRPEDRPQGAAALADALFGEGDGRSGDGRDVAAGAAPAATGAAAFAGSAPPADPFATVRLVEDPFLRPPAPPAPAAPAPVAYVVQAPPPVAALAPPARRPVPAREEAAERGIGYGAMFVVGALVLLAGVAVGLWRNGTLGGARPADPVADGAPAPDAGAAAGDAAGDAVVEEENAAPSAADDAAVTGENARVDIDVLRNDYDPEGDELGVESFASGEHGEVARVGNRLRYTPDAGYVGEDRFAYVATDGRGNTSQASVAVTVLPADRPAPEPDPAGDPQPDSPTPPPGDDPDRRPADDPAGEPTIRTAPVAVEQVQPEYPELARRMGMEGRVVVEALVSPLGRVKEVRVQSTDNPMLNAAALDAVRRWTFEPAIDSNGEPAQAWVTVPIRFRARD